MQNWVRQFKPLFSNKLQLRQHRRAQKKGFYNQNLPVMKQTLAWWQQLAPALWHKLLHIMVPVTTKHSDSTIHPTRPREEFVPAPENRTRAERHRQGQQVLGEVVKSGGQKIGKKKWATAHALKPGREKRLCQRWQYKRPNQNNPKKITAILELPWYRVGPWRFLIHQTSKENTQNQEKAIIFLSPN